MSNQTLLLLAIFLPFVSCPLIALSKLKSHTGWLTLFFPILSTLAIIAIAMNLGWGASHVFEVPWIPSLGINLSFLFDGLSTFFGLIVSGMGILITFYAKFYLTDKYKFQNRFYAYLMLFMASMLGTVFSNNLMLLFVFWELTGLASFFLIGFTHEDESARLGAQMALVVTALTGLMLLIGVVITGIFTGTYDLSQLIHNPSWIGAKTAWMNVALIFFLIGAFGKSAQFPFQFWLPRAMAAPTPVSAYLHSATMVKLGIFLIARIYPIFISSHWWSPTIITIGFITMVLGSILALLSNDLKQILANSTVSQLGFIIAFYGMGTLGGVQHDYLHIMNHVLYKGSLFMFAGIIDHATGTRDIRKLGGLFKSMPFTAVAFLVTALSMAGIPGTLGFISKELMLTEIMNTVHSQGGGIYWLLPIGMGISAIGMVAFSMRLFINSFFGSISSESKSHLHRPSFWFQLPAILPAIFVLIFGLWPNLLGAALEKLSVAHLQANHLSHLAIWHGFNLPLGLSACMITLGVGLYILGQKLDWNFTSIPRLLRFDEHYDCFFNGMLKHSKSVTTFLCGDKSFDFLPITIGAAIIIIGGHLTWTLFHSRYFLLSFLSYLQHTNKPHFLELFTSILILLGAVGTVFYKTWMKKLIALTVTGFMITFYFVLYQAPDLALTQMLIETASLILTLLFLTRLPKSDEIKNQKAKLNPQQRTFAIFASLSIGIILFVLMISFIGNPSSEPIGDFFIKHTLSLAEGTNSVNTLLVDFRGYDTMGEISVLVIAMLGVLGLLMRNKNPFVTKAPDVMKSPGGQT